MIAKTPFKIMNYFSLGIFISSYILISSILSFIANAFVGFGITLLFILKTISNILKIIFEAIKKIAKVSVVFLRLLSRGFIEVSKMIFKMIMSAINAIFNFLKRVISGFVVISFGVYRFIFYEIKGILLIIKKFIKLNKYTALGFTYISFLVYRFGRYAYVGLKIIAYPAIKIIKLAIAKYKDIIKLKREKAEIKYKENRALYERKRAERIAREADIKAQRAEIIAERKRKKENDHYENKEVVVEAKTFAERINDFLMVIINGPKKLKKQLISEFNNLALVKNYRNKRDIEKEALLLGLQGEDKQRSTTKQLYEYVARNLDNKVVKGYFDAYSRVEVHSFLLSEGFEVYSIKTSKFINTFYGNPGKSKFKVKTKDLIFFLTQLSTYIKAGIPLVEALKILTNQFKNKSYQRIFRSLIYDLTMGDSFSESMAKQGEAFPKLLINMVKTAEMTGQLDEVLDDMTIYYTQIDKTRKQMVTIMMYPAIIFFVSVAVITFILMFVIPRFVQIYDAMDSSQIPGFTLFIMGSSDFLKNNIIWLALGVIAIFLMFRYLYRNVKLFKTFIQWILMHIPGVGEIIIYNEVTMFSKTFSSLLSHNVFITDSMDILNKITNNEIYKMIILDTITNLAKGEKISTSFKNHWAFPMPAYEMIVTGEKTGQLPEMMAKVSDYYQELHANSITRIKAFIEPILIIFLTIVVGGIVLAIIIPMFNMYQTIQA